MRLPRVPHIVIGFVITIVLAGGSWIASNYSSHSQGALVLLPYQNVNEPFTYVYNPFQGTCGYGAACFSNGCQINTPSSGSCSCTGWKCGAGEKCIIDNTQPAASAFKACGECTKDSECTGGKRCDLSDYKCKNPCSLSNMPACSTKDGTLVTSSLQLQPGASCDLETTPCCVDGFEVTPETFVGFRCLNSTCEQNANEEWKCTAPQQMVACCNQYTGQCRMEPDQTGYCASTADTKHPGQTCDTFTCPKPKGSCCNKVNNTCTADVSQENCAAESMTFNSGMTCEQAACSQNKCPYPQVWNDILQRCMGGQNPQQCNGTYLPVYGCCEEPFQTEEGGVGGMLACCCPQGASCDVPGFSFRCWNSLGGNNPGGTGGINGGGGGDDGGGAGDGGAGGGGNDGGGGDGGGTPGGTSGDIGGTSGQSSPPSTPSTSSLNSSSSTSRSSSSPAPATSSSSSVSSTDGYCCNSDKVCRKGAGCTATLFSCLVECSGTSLSSSSASPGISSSSLSSSSVSVLRSSSSFRSSSSRTSDLSSASSTSSTSFSSVSSGDDSSESSSSSTSSDISSSRSSSRSSRSSSSSRSSRSSSSSVPTIGGSCRGDECSIGGSQFCGIQNMTCTQTSNFPCIRCVGSSSSIFVAGSCRGDECDMGGDAFCAVQNAACVTSPNFPCIRCIPLAQSSRSSVTIVTFNSSTPILLSSTPTRSSRPQLALELTCGDGMQNPGEECDDGNDISGDGCSSSCEREFCGNARLDEGEVCDEGALNSNNPNAPCRLDCTPQRCGDGIIDTPLEICDDGNTRDNDGCSFNCLLERTAPQTLPAQIIELPFTPELPDTNVAYIPPTTTHTPNPPANTDTGPAALAIMISGAAAGYAYMRRRKL